MPRAKSFDEHQTLMKIGQLFWQQGYTATGMDQISELVALKKTSLYNAYGDKATLFRKVVDWYIEEMIGQASGFLTGTDAVSMELSALMRHFLVLPEEEIIARGCLITNGMLELRHREPALYDYVRERFQRVADAVAAYLAAAQAAGRLDVAADPSELAAFVMTVFQGMRVQTRVQNDGAHRERIIQLAMAPLRAVERRPQQKQY